MQGQNDVPVIPAQGNAMYSSGACAGNKPAWQEGGLRSECDVQVIYLSDFLIKISLDYFLIERVLKILYQTLFWSGESKLSTKPRLVLECEGLWCGYIWHK